MRSTSWSWGSEGDKEYLQNDFVLDVCVGFEVTMK